MTTEIKLPDFTLDELKKSARESRNRFNVTKKGKSFQVEILKDEIQTLRPITLLDDDTKMILVYLPTKIIEISDKEGKPDSEPEFENKAYFMINQDGKKLVSPNW